jgi:tight adherence protein B
MTPLPWLTLAVAVLLVPRPVVTGRRVGGLARRGRLALAAPAPRRLARPRVPVSIVVLAGGLSAAAAVGCFAGLALAVAVGVAALTGTALTSAATARRRDAHRRQELLAAVRLIVAELEAGSRPRAALQAGAASAPRYAATLTRAAAVAESGGDITAALLSGGGAELAPLAHAWRVGTLCGAPMADVLARVAADLADREAQRATVTVALAGPRSTGALLAGLPVVGVVLGAAMGARPVQFLLSDPGGRLLCCLGVVLDAAGVLWTQRLLSRAQRE